MPNHHAARLKTRTVGVCITIGLMDSLYQGARGITKPLVNGEHIEAKDIRNASRAVNVLHLYPGMIQTINAMAGAAGQ